MRPTGALLAAALGRGAAAGAAPLAVTADQAGGEGAARPALEIAAVADHGRRAVDGAVRTAGLCSDNGVA
jgi:hypothetical protein